MTGTRTGRLLDHNILANQPTGGILNKLNLYDQYTGKINDAVRTSDSWVCEIPSKFLEKTVDNTNTYIAEIGLKEANVEDEIEMTVVTKKGFKGAEKYDSMTGEYNKIVRANSEAPSSVGHQPLGMGLSRNVSKCALSEVRCNPQNPYEPLSKNQAAEVCSLDIQMNRSSRAYDLRAPELTDSECESDSDSESDIINGVNLKPQPDPDSKKVILTKILEFVPARKPEQAKIGEVVRFMHIPENSHSTYWMQGTLEKRVDKYKDAKESGFTKNRFRVKNLTIINRWGEKGTIPETLTVNLTRNTAWALGTEVELHTTEEDEAIMFEQSKICDTADEEDEVAEVCSLDILMDRSSRV